MGKQGALGPPQLVEVTGSLTLKQMAAGVREVSGSEAEKDSVGSGKEWGLAFLGGFFPLMQPIFLIDDFM